MPNSREHSSQTLTPTWNRVPKMKVPVRNTVTRRVSSKFFLLHRINHFPEARQRHRSRSSRKMQKTSTRAYTKTLSTLAVPTMQRPFSEATLPYQTGQCTILQLGMKRREEEAMNLSSDFPKCPSQPYPKCFSNVATMTFFWTHPTNLSTS